MSEHTESYIVDAAHSGNRLDLFLSEVSSHSRSHIKKLVSHGYIHIEDTVAKKAGILINEGQTIRLEQEASYEHVREEEKVDTSLYAKIVVLGETSDYVVIHKPAGLLVHPTEAGEKVTLTAWLVQTYPDIEHVGENPVRPGIVHRLDKEASGTLVVAKTNAMFHHLKDQFKARSVEKQYTVLVYGTIEANEDTIDFPIDRGNDGRMVSRPRLKAVTLNTVDNIQPGKEARTDFKVIKRLGRFSLLSVRIHSGRTHQIRVHMYAYAHPVVGDTLYFNKKLLKKNDEHLGRLFLHAAKLCFQDLAGAMHCFESPLPEELQQYLDSLA
ncbi:MAG TPA: hypothetical protein DEP63_02685 [Candidatus Magasanikbacteria bacterium]|uniref:Pseudouridine synthase n=1 Tax=Candidatus Magasanikbacteria bacterium GW2011_GWE2_42_7 TaxID=1619052 RepID=A0A0G1BHA5_9BACT|nr:MAG: Pseudouridine synthase [Candidatus Magasanikbacteria bacterium GW2011_GWC2_42_27]KKS72712.1 MAG: Pseudouridine synthase [Candidatus Magasanikbacteria bacterium GW2011_GWE2_42_7]HBB38313.1 hypothetical protein [Candidatus Magasanikbacteria bacterium]HCC13629.1 hypothetical protein [Candidatus Magasanikbacteria bacterium]HCM53757.1 hypothetical protein [Candidatus Magasanikbacteria bacterium]